MDRDYNTGNCQMWFGTPTRMGWIDVPVSGADSSPDSWGAAGTTANGLGYALNSWGSHKVYNYEWRSSSTRQMAQKIKSYADGTFGRGLIYFLDPLAYDTNLLPARWADPSVTANQDGHSLVYGVDVQSLVSVGGEENGYPVYNSTYNMTGVKPGFRGVEQSVFIPIPTGYTLVMGASYSSSGTSGVFVSPRTDTGATGTPVQLTPLDPDSKNVVEDRFFGVSGVYLWVGRLTDDPGAVSIRGMSARLIRSELSVQSSSNTNLFRNPRMETASSSDPQAPAYVYPVGIPGSASVRRSSVWSAEAGYSCEVVADPAGTSPVLTQAVIQNRALVPSGPQYFQAGKTYTVTCKMYLDSAQSSPTSQSPALLMTIPGAPNAIDVMPNVAGVYTARIQAEIPADADVEDITLSIVGGNLPGDSNVFFDLLTIVEGIYDGPPFSGSTPDVDNIQYSWSGAPDASTSVRLNENRVFSQLKRGPWIGGQGHSGCRFEGKPTYVENNGVGGGQVSFAARFREVGDALYGTPGIPTINPAPANTVAYGYGPPPEELKTGIYLDVSQPNPVIYMPPGSEV